MNLRRRVIILNVGEFGYSLQAKDNIAKRTGLQYPFLELLTTVAKLPLNLSTSPCCLAVISNQHVFHDGTEVYGLWCEQCWRRGTQLGKANTSHGRRIDATEQSEHVHG